MDLLQYTINICKEHNLQLRRSKGQNFLVDEEVYETIVNAADIDKNDKILEVGPGLGILTRRLAAEAGEVTAVELDDKLAGFLRDEVKRENIGNVEIINADILDLAPENLDHNKIAANLPYNITSVFIRKFLAVEKTESLVLMLQKEVAERITAGRKKMSLLAFSVQLYADAEIIQIVDKSCFWPSPQVDSAIIKIKKNPAKLDKIKSLDVKALFRLVKIGFSAKRKMLKNNLAAGYHISTEEAEKIIVKAGLPAKCRPQDLEVDDWVGLMDFFGR
jgi:16S rRNA (adenine1518-N6/adenine1519-N6)-dimethyltransferase